MKILIVASNFWPDASPRGHRWTKLAASMAAAGHKITVITAMQKGRPEREFFENVVVRRTGHASIFDFFRFHFSKNGTQKSPSLELKKPSRLKAFAAFLYQKGLKKLFFPDESIIWRCSATRLAEAVLAEKGPSEPFDALITVSMPFAAQLVGRRLKKTRPDLFWLCDIGDPLALHDDFLSLRWPIFERLNRRAERSVLEKCDAATVTNSATRGRFEAFFGKTLVGKIVVAPPVFEVEKAETPDQFSLKKAAGEVHLGYFGALYRPFRSPEAVVDFLERTEKARPRLARRLVFHFFGEVRAEFFAMLGASDRVILHGSRPRAEAQKAMREMDFLVNIGNRGDYLLPSKAAEYLATGSAVVHFSHVERDPFSHFFEKSTAFLAVSVKNEAISEADLERLWAWLEAAPPRLEAAETARLIEPFRAENVARGMLEILGKGISKQARIDVQFN